MAEEEKQQEHSLSKELKDFLLRPKPNMTAWRAALKVEALTWAKAGDLMEDGSIYLGFHKNRDWFVTAVAEKTAKGAHLMPSFNAAAQYARRLEACGHKDWTVPVLDILAEMFNHKDDGAFKNTYDKDNKWHWSSDSHYPDSAWVQCFSSGLQGYSPKTNFMSVRCVRSQPRLPVPGTGGYHG